MAMQARLRRTIGGRTTRARSLASGFAWCALVAASASGGCAKQPIERQPPVFPVPRRAYDDALHHLVVGSTWPPVDVLDDRDLDAMARLLGGLLHTYQAADFDTFLAMRREDLLFAESRRDGRELGPVLAELGIEVEGAPTSWIAALRACWKRYYEDGPVVGLVEGETQARLVLATRAELDWAARERRFSAPLEGSPFVEHRLAIPHRRTIEQIASETAGLAWIEFDLRWTAPEGAGGRTLLRFVHDGIDRDWFLHRAITRIDVERGSSSSPRNLIL